MKKMIYLSFVVLFFILYNDSAKANSWKKPKEMETILYRIDMKIEELMKEKSQKQTKLEENSTHFTKKQKEKIILAIKDLSNRITELNVSKRDIEILKNDPNHVYILSENGENYVIRKSETEIIIQGANDALLIHEIRHVSLWLQTGWALRFNKGNMLMPIYADGSIEELQSYRAQYAYEPSSLPGTFPKNIELINIEYIGNIKREDGSIAYPIIHKMWQVDLKITQQQIKMKQLTHATYTTNDTQ